jgi:hypothetical protein
VDANTIAANAVQSAWGYRTQAVNYKNDALMSRATASGISPGLNAASTLLGEAGQVASTWYGMNKAGAFAPNDVQTANMSSDPIGSLGNSRGWWSK